MYTFKLRVAVATRHAWCRYNYISRDRTDLPGRTKFYALKHPLPSLPSPIVVISFMNARDNTLLLYLVSFKIKGEA